MNFLSICRKLRDRAPGIGGSAGQPASVLNQTGDMARVVDWAREAWIDIQSFSPHWGFMREQFSATVPAGLADVLPAQLGVNDLAMWHDDTLRCYRPSVGVQEERYLISWGYEVLRNTYRFGAQAPGLPSVFSVRPRDKAIMLGPSPIEDVIVAGEYQRRPQILEQNTDEPLGLPEDFHMLIVYRAMLRHAGFEAAPEIYADAKNQEAVLWNRLVNEWLPQITLGDSFA